MTPAFERVSKVVSLHELRAVSLELRPNRPVEPPRSRRESSLTRQPFIKSYGRLSFKAVSPEGSSLRSSNFNFNHCFREDDSKLIGFKMRIKPEGYLKLENFNKNPLLKHSHQELFR